MKILVSNDDGVHAEGIQELAKVLSDMGEVYIVAPSRERSTAGHSLTLHKPVRIELVGKNQYSVSGTPADCIYLGIWEILKEIPALVVSGINRGANLGTDVYYSGTVAAAREGALCEAKAYAFSLVDLKATKVNKFNHSMDFKRAAIQARKVIDQTFNLEFPPHALLNVNIPNLKDSEIKGIKVTKQGIRHYATLVEKREDPRGKPYFWIGGGYKGFKDDVLSDCQALDEQYVAITPINIDSTHNEFYTTLLR